MIYLVEINFSDPVSEPEWDEWYKLHLRSMITVPGILTAQRFRASGDAPYRYLAAYAVSSIDVFSSDAYRSNGGAGRASLRWKNYISRRRVAYSGIDWLPEVSDETAVLLGDGTGKADLKDVLLAAIERVGLDEVASPRQYAIVSEEIIDAIGPLTGTGLSVYRPISQRYLAA
jgi:hypothetical protein